MGKLANYIKTNIKRALYSRSYFISRAARKSAIVDFLQLVKDNSRFAPLQRIGGTGDGGYLVPCDLNGITVCFSPGVSDIANFEMELLDYNIPSEMIDYSVEQSPVSHEMLNFRKKFLGLRNDDVYIKFDTWISESGFVQGEYILQMDIEGAEYLTLLDISENNLEKFRILIIEFHDLDLIYTESGFDKIFSVFNKLFKFFYIVHIHPNNCRKPLSMAGIDVPPVLEITFLRKDRFVSSNHERLVIPNQLDAKCVDSNEELELPRCWYQK